MVALERLIEIIDYHISKYYVKIMNILKLVKEDPMLREQGMNVTFKISNRSRFLTLDDLY